MSKMLVVVDTNIVNYYIKNDKIWDEYKRLLKEKSADDPSNWVLCFATIQELFSWSLTQPDYDESITNFIKSCQIAPVTLSCCRTAARIRNFYGRTEARWHDVWIAAIAVDNHLPLVTNNPSDFGKLTRKFNLHVLSVK